eukprot:6172478-Amphidinium_carterae.2
MRLLSDLITHDSDRNLRGVELAREWSTQSGKAFGALPRCSSCGGGRIRFEGGVYSCPGMCARLTYAVPVDYSQQLAPPWSSSRMTCHS